MNLPLIFNYPLIISAIAIFISLIALYFTIRRFLLKYGTKIRGSYVKSSSIDCDDDYVSRIILENQKDRAITIFGIYLKIGNNIYIEIDNFEENPLILKPFEVFHKSYDPIEKYVVSMRHIKINNLFNEEKYKKQIILSTTNGRYKVARFVPQWNPIYDFFKNHMTGTAHPVRNFYKGRAYGSNIKYLASFKVGENEEVVPIHLRDYEWKHFKKFRLTEESLKTKESLEKFLTTQKRNGNILVDSIIVHDMDEWRTENEKDYVDEEPIQAEGASWFMYHVVGRLLTNHGNWKMRRENRRNQKKQKTTK